MADDLLNRANLGLLPDQGGRFGSFGLSLVINVAIAGLVALLSIAGAHEIKKQQETAVLIFPAETPKPPPPPPVPRVKVIPPPPKIEMERPKIEMPKPVVQPPPKPEEIKMPDEAPKLAPSPPKRVTPPPQPKVGLFQSSHPTLVANNTQKPSTKTGGFGDPEGVHPNPNATRPANIAAAGSFAGTPGVGQPGAGAARKGSVHGVDFGSGVVNGVPGGKDTHGTVASAGFGTGVIGGTGKPGGTGRAVESGGFGTNIGQAGPTTPKPQEVSHSTPLVLLSKPKPGYTEEARRMKIEGDVTLQVRFTASGQVEVLRVVSGLGHGLDELAQDAARRIQFKPATRDGHPVDEVTIIHVTFQLA